MSEQNTSTTTDQSAQTGQTVTEQDGTDWKAEARKWENRAKENRAAADELAALKDSQKTAEQRFEDRLREVEQRAADAETKALRSDIAAEHGITAQDRDLFLTGTDEETLTAQAKRLAERETERKKQGNHAPREGDTKQAGNANEQSAREFAGELFGSQ